MQIHIGNLNMMTTARQLAELFLPFGRVSSSKILSAGPKGLSTGAGFIEMDTACGRQAIRKLHRLLFMNSYIEVKEVRQ
jgi:RNA recognition motif-containing protein